MVLADREAYDQHEFDSAWPVWQEGMEKKCLVAVEVQETVDNLFRDLFQTHSTFQRKAQEARHYTQQKETNWTVHFMDLPTAHNFQWSHTPVDLMESAPSAGMMRKVLFTCPGNALHPGSFRTEQVERCVEYVAGQRFVVDVCVLSSPMYCDRFRPIVRYTAEKLGPDNVKLIIDYQIIYVAKVNFVLKKFIEKSARGGMEESYRKWLEALKNHYASGVIDLFSNPRRRKSIKHPKKDLQSHRLTDVPFEIVEELDEVKTPTSDSFSKAIILLTLLLPVLRIIWFLVTIPNGVASVLASVRRRFAAYLTWSFIFQALLMFLLALLVRSLPPIPVAAFMHEAYCSEYGPILCFSVSFISGVLAQRTLTRYQSTI